MAKITLVPKHYTAQMFEDEVYDLIATLSAAEREFKDGTPVPDSVIAFKERLIEAYDGDLPGDEHNPIGEEGGITA